MTNLIEGYHLTDYLIISLVKMILLLMLFLIQFINIFIPFRKIPHYHCLCFDLYIPHSLFFCLGLRVSVLKRLFWNVYAVVSFRWYSPFHKAKIMLRFLEEEGIAVMKKPPQSNDMNPQENVLKIIGEKAQNRNPQNIDNLWGFLKEEWESITTTFCKKLIGLGRRCDEVIQCKGKFIKYCIFL